MSGPLLTGPVTFYDAHRRVSALVTQHRGVSGRVALVYHDAPRVADALSVLGAVATALDAQGHAPLPLRLIETSLPEHPLERFAYAIAGLRHDGRRLHVAGWRVVRAARVAELCGLTATGLARLERQAMAAHRPHRCAFDVAPQLPLGLRCGRPPLLDRVAV